MHFNKYIIRTLIEGSMIKNKKLKPECFQNGSYLFLYNMDLKTYFSYTVYYLECY